MRSSKASRFLRVVQSSSTGRFRSYSHLVEPVGTPLPQAHGLTVSAGNRLVLFNRDAGLSGGAARVSKSTRLRHSVPITKKSEHPGTAVPGALLPDGWHRFSYIARFREDAAAGRTSANARNQPCHISTRKMPARQWTRKSAQKAVSSWLASPPRKEG